MAQVYLDTSALAKRYVREIGTDIVDLVFEQASPEHPLVFSFWNIGESLGVYDQYLKRKEITEEQLKGIIRRMSREFSRLTQQRTLLILPLSAQVGGLRLHALRRQEISSDLQAAGRGEL